MFLEILHYTWTITKIGNIKNTFVLPSLTNKQGIYFKQGENGL